MNGTQARQRPRRTLGSPYTSLYADAGHLIRERYISTFPVWQLPLEAIRLDGSTQARLAISTLVVDEYATAMHAGTPFPPVTVFRDGQDYWLADGFHRVFAARQAGLPTIAAEIHPGTQRNAILYAVGANAKHGLRRSNADKRNAVMRLLSDPEWRLWSNREIARRCHVDEGLVRKVRKGVSADCPQMIRYAERHGTVYSIHVGAIGLRAEPSFDTLASIDPDVRAVLHGTTLADDLGEMQAVAKIADAVTQAEVVRKVLVGEAQSVREAIRQLAYADKQSLTLQETISGRFSVVYADPPWEYSNARLQGAAAAHYPTMSTVALGSLPVIDYVTTNAVLFLWATNPLLKDALTVMDAWGFEYRTNLVWVKDQATYGKLGFYAHGRHELLLIGVRGSCLPKADCLPDSVFTTAKGRHSEKPDDVYALIEQMYDGPYLELFARQTRPTWVSFGNEVREQSPSYPARLPTRHRGDLVLTGIGALMTDVTQECGVDAYCDKGNDLSRLVTLVTSRVRGIGDETPV